MFIHGNDIKPQITTNYVEEGIKCLLYRAEVKGMLEDFFVAIVGRPEEEHCTFEIVMSKGVNTFAGIKVGTHLTQLILFSSLMYLKNVYWN